MVDPVDPNSLTDMPYTPPPQKSVDSTNTTHPNNSATESETTLSKKDQAIVDMFLNAPAVQGNQKAEDKINSLSANDIETITKIHSSFKKANQEGQDSAAAKNKEILTTDEDGNSDTSQTTPSR